MKFGIVYANAGPFTDPVRTISMARAAEAAGFESLWTIEHAVVPAGYASAYPYDKSGKMPGADDAIMPDPLIWLAYVAAATSTINLATGILILPQRNPVVLAKEVSTLDFLSGGRMQLGVGIGWLEEEFNAIGVPFGERSQRLEDGIGAMRALWSQDAASYDGTFTSFERCILRPQPVHGSVPIHIGGHSEAAARRAGRIGDGFFPATGSHRTVAERVAQLTEAALEAGRDPSSIEITCGGNGVFGPNGLDEAKALADLGVTRVVVPSFLFFKDTEDALAAYGEEIIGRA